jgi:hypothetical protein
MLRDIPQIDLNPPVLYLLDYFSLHVFAHLTGPLQNTAARLPSLTGGLIASVALFAFLRGRVGALYALAGVGLLWDSRFFLFVTEDRPYALLVGLLVLLLLAWERATQPQRNPLWVCAVLLVGLAMMGSHFMAGFLLLAFLGAETARAWCRGRLDAPVLLGLVVPFVIPLYYRQVFKNYDLMIFPAKFQVSVTSFGTVYWSLLADQLPSLAICLLLCVIATTLSPPQELEAPGETRVFYAVSPESHKNHFTLPERVLFFGLLLEPLMSVISQSQRHAGFFLRYALPGCVPIAVLATLFLFRSFRHLKRVALITVAATFVGTAVPLVLQLARALSPAETVVADAPATDYRTVSPELPLVAASGLTFVEMNHREDPNFLHRLYYLTDTPAAVQYAHATMFEGEAKVSRMFHFQSFEAAHPKFLVLGTYDYPEDWLLRKLQADGDSLRYLGRFETSYKDKELYEVTVKTRQ